jgi:hypothetical protein
MEIPMKQVIVACLAIVLLGSAACNPAWAWGGGGHGGGFGGGGGHYGGGGGFGGGGHYGGGYGWGGHYGGYGGGWGYGRGGYYGGYYGGIGIGIYGPGLGYYGSPYYSPYYAYPPAVVTVPVAPPVYIQQANPQPATQPQANYWHYCRNPEGYYPYVKECPDGWQQVAPQPSDR